jgi:hypothetical protein
MARALTRVWEKRSPMLLPPALSRLPELIGAFIAARSRWTPIGKAVSLFVDYSEDHAISRTEYAGRIRAHDERTGALLIVLSELLTFSDGDASDVVAVCPTVRWHRPPRLLVSWTAVRVVKTTFFRDLQHGRVVGTGRLVLNVCGHTREATAAIQRHDRRTDNGATENPTEDRVSDLPIM